MKKTTERRYADTIASIIEDESAPNVLRELMQLVCASLDTYAAPYIKESDAYAFRFGHSQEITPSDVRRRLPAMLKRVGHWRPAHYTPHELSEPKGGQR